MVVYVDPPTKKELAEEARIEAGFLTPEELEEQEGCLRLQNIIMIILWIVAILIMLTLIFMPYF